ncbi:response regulator [Blastococcus saxobsidens]|uniref:response regulator n=1 Tax=Blastococcus saxobsidens TaxID=138336 RepID=UPI000CEBD99E|nr:response regulator transcription factor [Blastococcus saxobsidens]
MPTVVVIDDDPMIRALLRSFIAQDRRVTLVAEATNGVEGIEVVTSTQPDAIILDMEMPEMDGVEALPQLRASSPRTTVVMFSSGPRPATEPKARAAGAHGYFEKSTPLEELFDHLVDLTNQTM